MLQEDHSDDLLNYYAIHEAQNANNTRTFGIWFDDKLWILCNTQLLHCQKVTVVLAT